MTKFDFEISGQPACVNLEKSGDGYAARIGERTVRVEPERAGSGVLLLEVDGERHKAFIARDAETYFVSVHGATYEVKRAAGGGGASAGAQKGGDSLAAPMPGKVIKILCKPGDRVAAGQTLAILEAMKMENNLDAPRDARVRKVTVRAGDQVGLAATLVEFEPE